jgi:hypothetical protein
MKQPWIGKPLTDVVFILLPPFISLLIVLLFPTAFQNVSGLSNGGWIVLVLLVDVAHVYSTLYRTYFDPQALRRQRFLLWAIPFVGFVVGVILYSISSLLFWSVLAYVAVYHFVRQQYGFMRVYSRREHKQPLFTWIDTIAVYAATIYPLLHWHLSGSRHFNWFTDGDFLIYPQPLLLAIGTALYALVMVGYGVKEMYLLITTHHINVPRFLLIAGTAVSWYFGIVYFNGDAAFTLLNVVSHGIPYMALVWLHGRRSYLPAGKGNRFLKVVFSGYGILVFLGLIFLLAFVEEGLWDVAVWKEHSTIFGTAHLSNFTLSPVLLSFIVPLLALPQITHYVLDGFIWKIRQDEFKWNNEVKKGGKVMVATE